MSTAVLELSSHRRKITRGPSSLSRPLAPAVYIGTVAGFRDIPAIDLFNLLAAVGEHPAGSTVSRKTLERFGFRAPAVPLRHGPRDASRDRAALVEPLGAA